MESMRAVMLCMEDELYRLYLEQALPAGGLSCTVVPAEDLAAAIAERQSGTLLLQSDTAEQSLIETSSRLKRLFGDELRVVLLSSDYQVGSEAGSAVDAFVHYPVDVADLRKVLAGLDESGRRILLIDDSRLVHNHLVPPLRDAGYEVAQAFDGEDGLAQARALRPHLVICDIEMPKMNGFEVCAAIRATDEIAGCHIVMSSTLGSAADQQKGFAAGVDEYITKPVVVPELLDRIRKALNRARGGRESILVVQGDEQTAKGICKALTKQGFGARHAATLKDVRRMVARASYDLVVSELDLADGSVIDLMTTLDRRTKGQKPDVLILMGRDSQADAKVALNAGAAGVIGIPFTTDALLASAERTLADRRAAQERAHLQKYVSKASVRMALEKSALGGGEAAARAYRKTATVFFSDIANFTTRCETYPPREVVAQVNLLFEVMTQTIMGAGGDIDKFIGDACMAFWDGDVATTAERALRATLQMRPRIQAMNAAHPLLASDPITIRMGLNSGEVILCDLGAADARMDLTVIGDTVNLAARLEAASKQYGVTLLVGEATFEPVRHLFAARLIDLVRVKGKLAPVACYEVLAEHGGTTDRENRLVEVFGKATAAFQSGEFRSALELFEAADAFEAGTDPGALNPSRLYQERCRELIATPPAAWDGVWTLRSK